MKNRNAFCSFCRKSYRDVGPLVEGPGDVYICGECTELCQAIIEQEKRRVVFVSGAERLDAQDALLTLWQQGVGGPVPGLQLDVHGILFVCGGTFAGLDEAIVRLGRHPEQPVTAQALRAVEVRAEWARALAAIARVPPLDEETLERIVDRLEFRKV